VTADSFRRLTGWTLAFLVASTLTLQVVGLIVLLARNNRVLSELATGQDRIAHVNFLAREQNRCVAWEAQNTLRQIILLTPHLTAAEIAQINKAIPLPSIKVRLVSGRVMTLNCLKVITEPVPGA
jgi:hypothetical protein